MDIDLTFDNRNDRLLIRLHDNSTDLSWWLTRRVTLRLIKAWADKLEQIGLPKIDALPHLPPRDIGLEHNLSLEFDGPKSKKAPFVIGHVVHLVEEIDITVSSIGCQLHLKSKTKDTRFSLTRMQSHAILEMLSNVVKRAKWLEQIDWPKWL